MLGNKYQEILSNDWDYLIILDACRPDSFRRHYPNAEIRISKGSCTTEWLHRTFYRPMKDVTYISTNPFINNLNIPLNEASNDCKSNWNPTTHFKEVIDIWRTHWNKELGTVHPKNVNETVKKHLGKRLIIHYIQPHEPYLNYKSQGKEWIIAKGKKPKRTPFFWDYLSFKQRILLKKICGHKLSVFENFIDKGEVTKLKELYEQNVDLVMEYVKKLLPDLKGKIIITADHSEAFGEHGLWGHPKSEQVFLRTIPYLEVLK